MTQVTKGGGNKYLSFFASLLSFHNFDLFPLVSISFPNTAGTNAFNPAAARSSFIRQPVPSEKFSFPVDPLTASQFTPVPVMAVTEQNRKGKCMNKKITKQEWVALFKDAGLSDAMMKKWHQLFESRHPEGHDSFLRWLGLPDTEIDVIRKNSR